VPKTYSNLADIGPASARWVIRGCQAAWVLAVVLLCRAAFADPAQRRGVRAAAEFLARRARDAPVQRADVEAPRGDADAAVRGAAGVPGGPPGRARAKGFVAVALAAAGALILVTSALPRDEQNVALTYGTHTAAFLLLTAAVCTVMWQERASRGPAGVPSGE